MQSDRPISVSSPLGPDVLLFYRMTATESLGRLFDFDLDVLSKDHNIKLGVWYIMKLLERGR